MNEKVLRTLEFDKIREKLSALAFSDKAKAMCRELVPFDEIGEIRKAQKETGDALSRVYKSGRLSFSGLSDIGASLVRLDVGATLGMGELISISKEKY